MRRHRVLGGVLWLGLGMAATGTAQDPPATAPPPARRPPTTAADAILQALHDNPVTAPYLFRVRTDRGRMVLSGRVATKQIHDTAIQTLIALGLSARDDLVIDTSEAYRSVAAVPPATGISPYSTYVYPPPLMGRLDDPFFGLEPPLVSFPPWWKAVSQREPLRLGALDVTPATPELSSPDPTVSLPPGTIEMTMDTRGVAVLRGTVPTLADRIAVGQKVAKTPGVTQVVNLLQVGAGAAASSDIPPPPPTPSLRSASPPRAPEPGAEEKKEPISIEADPLARKVADTLSRRPALAGQTVQASARDGVVTLSGRLPSAYEAMVAYRAAEQTPGVRAINDRLEFALPDGEAANPLRTKGKPEDVEAYLLAQVRHQLGSLAHVDAVTLRGDSLELRGTVARADDTARVEAALRSIPLLRGFRLEPSFSSE